ncbi:MAG: hypothetical protein HRU38_02385 [Saccharospirillaceae bacterium]|nr:PEP-utilizing enzyme [Pseudomonadales bacterium]NRB77508.1 hypothetical protein [Saccharospirillaceae bacterium]
MEFLIQFDDNKQQLIELVGGKATQLYQLGHLDLNIPQWVSVSASFLSCVLNDIDLNSIEEVDLETSVIKIIKDSKEFISLKHEVNTYLDCEGPQDQFYAVRSSILEEDGKGFSYAGLMQTHLYQQSIDQIMHSICLVLASAFSPQALMFRKKSQLGVLTKASVMIQTMIQSDVSGVCFTVNPQTGRFDQSLINANFGLCESVVAALSVCDEYCIDNNQVINNNINIKTDYCEYDKQQGKVVQKDQIKERQSQACLNKEQVLQIYQAGQLISKNKQYPQDIEWTIKDNQLYILQARAITRVGFDKHESKIYWDNSNIQESYYGVTTPLTFSFIQEAYKTVYQQTMTVMGISDATIKEYQPVLNNLLGSIHGQVYYNINNWYKGLMLLPGFNKNKRDMEEMMGLSHSVDIIEDKQFSTIEKIVQLPSLVVTYARLLIRFSKLEKLSIQFNKNFKEVYSRYQNDQLQTMSFSELVELTLTLKTQVLENWSTPIINDFYVMMKNGQLTDYLKKHNVKDPQQLKSLLIFNHEQDIESTEPTKAVIQISIIIKQDEALKTWFMLTDSKEVIRGLKQYPKLKKLIDTFIEKYGDRCIGELKLETKSYRQQPEMLVELIINYLTMDQVVFNEQPFTQKMLSNQTLLKSKSFNKKMNKLKTAIAQRENMRFQRTRLFGLYREIFLEIGKRLTLLGLINTVDDIFYLKWDEIINLSQHTLYDENLKVLIDGRQQQAEAFNKLNPDDHFKSSSAGFVQNNPAVFDDKQQMYQGLGCFPGVVRGQIKKVENHSDVKDLQGKILLAKRTDPGWTPLFPTCSAVIVERGSALSHSAIIARELGLVAIVNVENICRFLNDGDWVEVDGSAGTIIKIEPELIDK